MIARDREAARRGVKIYTEIALATRFYRAEEYHQKYYRRKRQTLMQTLHAIYSNDQALVDSTVAARLNGYAAGHGKFDTLESELKGLGLPAAQGEKLLNHFGPTVN